MFDHSHRFVQNPHWQVTRDPLLQVSSRQEKVEVVVSLHNDSCHCHHHPYSLILHPRFHQRRTLTTCAAVKIKLFFTGWRKFLPLTLTDVLVMISDIGKPLSWSNLRPTALRFVCEFDI